MNKKEKADIDLMVKVFANSMTNLKERHRLDLKRVCRKQKEICAERARAKIIDGKAIVINTSILLAPNAE